MRLTAGLALTLAIALMAGCGGGGTQLADGGIGGTGVTRGPVTDLSSITLNERRLDTQGATVLINGAPALLSELRPGYVVTVEADFAAGTAQRVTFQPDVVGQVSATSLSGGAGTMTVLGQTVVIDQDTIVADFANVDAIANGDRVLVSGVRTAEDAVLAERIELAPSSPDRVTGVMHSPGLSGAETLRMGALTVAHSNAAIADFPGGSPTPGDRIHVAGALGPDGVLRADSVEPALVLDVMPGDTVEVLGVLNGVAGSDALALEGLALVLAENLEVVGGGPDDLMSGARARIFGRAMLGGVVNVTRVVLDP